jgi:hypothetical protein
MALVLGRFLFVVTEIRTVTTLVSKGEPRRWPFFGKGGRSSGEDGPGRPRGEAQPRIVAHAMTEVRASIRMYEAKIAQARSDLSHVSAVLRLRAISGHAPAIRSDERGRHLRRQK